MVKSESTTIYRKLCNYKNIKKLIYFIKYSKYQIMRMSPCSATKPTNLMALAGFKSKYDKFNYLSSKLVATDCKRMPKFGFLTPSDFYKSLLASAVLQQQQQQQQRHSIKSNKFYPKKKFLENDKFPPISTKTAKETKNVLTGANNKPWTTNGVASEQTIINESTGNHHHSVNQDSSSLLSPCVTDTPPTPPDTTDNLVLSDNNFEVNRKSTTSKRREDLTINFNKSNSNISNNNLSSITTTTTSTKSELLSHGFLQQGSQSSSNMPIGGVQSQNPTQGLVHWMSVMAEHMNVQSHHDPTPVGMHPYMWNGNVDVSKKKKHYVECLLLIRPHILIESY